MKKFKNPGFSVIPLTFALMQLSACKLNESSTNRQGQGNDPIGGGDDITFAISAIGGAFDELSAPTATVCGKASGQTCNVVSTGSTLAGTQLVDYGRGCRFGSNLVTGDVRLSSNRADCKIPNATNDVIVVTQNVTFNPVQTNYYADFFSSLRTSGPSLGLGGGISFTFGGRPGTYSMRIPGFHKVTRNGNEVLTDQTISASRGLPVLTEFFDRSNRVIQSGSALVTNNISRSQVLLTFRNVVWAQEACCAPTGGSLEVQNAQDEDDLTTITFSTKCGEYTRVPKNGSSSIGTITNCGANVY